ncbi:MAG: NUDIX hydrolase [Chloroflexi bacterium]|nr:NUDIX hydrolase [Chloroflexota bacterium]
MVLPTGLVYLRHYWRRRAALRVTVDTVIFTLRERGLHVLLVRRSGEPFKGSWALPGGFVRSSESPSDAAERALGVEAGVRGVYLEQLYTFGEPKRDPRGRVLTVAYYALVSVDQALATGSHAAAASWFPVDALPQLAFDHRMIADYALERLRNKLEYTTVGFQLLPAKFTLGQLQSVYETILGRAVDKRNFRRKIELLGILTPLEERGGERGRPAQLYRFSARRFEKLKDKGILFPF